MATATGAAEDLRAAQKDSKQDVGQISQTRLMIRRFKQNKLSVFGLIALIILYAMAALAGFISPYNYNAIDSQAAYQKPTALQFPGGRPSVCAVKQELNPATFSWIYTPDCSTTYPVKFLTDGSPNRILGVFETNKHLFGVDKPAAIHIFGTDAQGRDVFSRVLEGSKVSLTVGLVGVAFATIFGAVFGTASGYFGGAIDNVMQRIIELISAIPTLPLWAAMAAALPRDMSVIRRYFFITIVLSLVSWTGLARQVRGKVLGYRNADYTAATIAAGGSHSRIILTHMIPNSLSHIIVVAMLAVPVTILGETGLSFLGLGMLPPAVSWGVLLQDAQKISTVTQYPWLLIPAAAVVFAITCYQFLGDGMRDAADPYS